jgi:hypothetical protein
MAKSIKSSKSKGSKGSKGSKTPKSSSIMTPYTPMQQQSQQIYSTQVSPPYTGSVNKTTQFSTGFTLFLVVLFIAVITIHILALMWLQKLETTSCKCSVNWKRDYIKYFLYAYFVFIALQLVSFLVTGKQLVQSESSIVRGLAMLFNIFAFANAFIVIFYVKELKDSQCKCSEDVQREVYYYWNIVYLALWALAVLMTLIAFIIGLIFLANMKRV